MSREKPRFRRNLESVPVEADGEKFVEVRDLDTGATFRFYDFEYRVALAFDGLTLDKVIPWVKLSTGLELQIEQLQAFVERLAEMGFLEGEPVPATAPANAPAEPGPAPAPIEANAPPAEEILAPADEIVSDSPDEDLYVAEPTPVGLPESTAFPILPAPASPPAPRPPLPEVVPASGPPPWMTPRPLMTPVPVTFGPSLIAEQPSSRRRMRRSMVLFGSLGVLAAAAVLALALPFLMSTQDPPKQRVRTLAAAPGTIFRYFDGAAGVKAVPGTTLKFPASGKVTRIASAGSAVSVGDVAATVESARPLQDQLTRQRERLAFHQQMAEAMHQVGNGKEEEKQIAKVELGNAKVAKTLRALAEVAVVVSAPGEVEEAMVRVGDGVEAGGPAFRLRSAGFRATFEFPRAQAAWARRLGFCQVEVEGYVFDCVQSQAESDETHLSVDIVSIPPSLLGKPAHLARARFEGAFAVPKAAIMHTGSRDEVFVVSPQARVESRSVTVAERDFSEAIVVQGLDVADNVIVEATPGLRTGVQVAVVP